MNDFRIKNPLLFIGFFQHTIDWDIVTLDSTKIKAYANKFKILSIVNVFMIIIPIAEGTTIPFNIPVMFFQNAKISIYKYR